MTNVVVVAAIEGNNGTTENRLTQLNRRVPFDPLPQSHVVELDLYKHRLEQSCGISETHLATAQTSYFVKANSKTF